MGRLIEAAICLTCAHTRHQIDPHGYLGAVEWCLFNNTLGTVADVAGYHVVGLIGGITQEVAFEHCRCSFQVRLQQMLIGIEYCIKLLLVWRHDIRSAYHYMILTDTTCPSKC